MADDPGRNLFGAPVGGQAARIMRTGLALVHEGEVVLPAAGSEAAAELVAHDDRVIVNYYFPVEIEVRSGGDPIDPRAAIEKALSALAQGLDST